MKKAVTLTGLMLLAACSPEQAEQQPETVEAASEPVDFKTTSS